jgi:hypothetical protein
LLALLLRITSFLCYHERTPPIANDDDTRIRTRLHRYSTSPALSRTNDRLSLAFLFPPIAAFSRKHRRRKQSSPCHVVAVAYDRELAIDIMSDATLAEYNYGGTDEENAEIRTLSLQLVRAFEPFLGLLILILY